MFESIFCHLVGSKKDYRHYVHEDENLLENCEKSDYEYVNVPCPVLSPSFSFDDETTNASSTFCGDFADTCSFVDFSSFHNFFDSTSTTTDTGATNPTNSKKKKNFSHSSSERKKHGKEAERFGAKPSRTVQLSKLGQIEGDGDVWVEVMIRSRSTDRLRTCFVSVLTGEKVHGEPPTGASRILYLP